MALNQDIIAFKAAYNEFGNHSDADIAAVFNTADVFLDTGSEWVRPQDFAKARQLWVAHWLTLARIMGNTMLFGTSTSSSTSGAVGGFTDLFVREIHIGERTVSFDRRLLTMANRKSTGTGPGEDELLLTIYGQLFLQLRTRNFPLVMVL
jgi:hypothetical protein